MHATHNQGGACPEPPASEPTLFGTVSRDGVFSLVRADGSSKYDAPPVTAPAGPDLKALTQPEFYHWATGTPACASDAPASEVGTPLPLGEVPHPAAHCDNGGRPHLGPCIEPDPGEAPGTAAVVLRSAALYLERYGWIQGAYYDSTPGRFTPPACMVGAIGMACYGGPVEAPAQHFDDPGFLDFEEAVLHLDRYLMVEDSSESYEFNDVRGRTVDQVTEVLRNAAARPAYELIDALRVIDAQNAKVAVLVDLLKPCGIWGEPVNQPVAHVDYPHTPGTLYDCPACEAECFCADGFQCVHCALEQEQARAQVDTPPIGDLTGGDGE